MWSKRFLRDPVSQSCVLQEVETDNSFIKLTVKQLYTTRAIGNSDAVSLLTGFPKATTLNPELSKVAKRACEANRVLQLLFEINLEAMREPSFSRSDWKGFSQLFVSVVSRRAELVCRLQETILLSDEDVYDTVWVGTLDLHINVKRRIMTVESELPNHFSMYESTVVDLFCPPEFLIKANLRFLDNLARARNQLWIEYRQAQNRACVMTPEPFPSGFPIQNSLPCQLQTTKASLMQFVTGRVSAVVFMGPEQARALMPTDNAVREVMEKYVDSYGLALELFVFSVGSTEEAQKRLDLAWTHIIDRVICPSDVLRDTAETYWRHKLFERVPRLRSLKIGSKPSTDMYDDYPRLPRLEDVKEVQEWDPCPEKELPPDAVTIPNSCFTHYFQPSRTSMALNRFPKQFSAPSRRKMRIWELHKLSTVTCVHGDIQEALILASLRYLDAKRNSGPRKLTNSFPSKEMIRYPALYLDDSFLYNRNFSEVQALKTLQKFRKRIPPSLLTDVCRAELKAVLAMDSTNPAFAKAERVVLGLLKLLTLSDRPDVASEFIHQILLDRPEASSYHRQLLTPRFLKSHKRRKGPSNLW